MGGIGLPPDERTRRSARTAFTLVEVIATLILLAAVFAVIGNLLVRVSQQSRSADRRRIAQEAAGNVLEALSARPWESIVSSPGDPTGDATALAQELASGLPGGAVTVDVTPDTTGEAKRIVVAVSWTEPSGQNVRPARLVTWVYRDGGGR